MLPELRQLFEEERERVQPLLEKGLNFAASYGKLKVCPFTINGSVHLLIHILSPFASSIFSICNLSQK